MNDFINDYCPDEPLFPQNYFPTAIEVSERLAQIIFNSRKTVKITLQNIKELSNRRRIKEGFLKIILDNLTYRGFAWKRDPLSFYITFIENNYISYEDALEADYYARSSGNRTIHQETEFGDAWI